MSTDAIVLLKEDHQQIRKLFTDFENADQTHAHPNEGNLS